jgi:hypothetical protein
MNGLSLATTAGWFLRLLATELAEVELFRLDHQLLLSVS